jgi:hypothetical protein
MFDFHILVYEAAVDKPSFHLRNSHGHFQYMVIRCSLLCESTIKKIIIYPYDLKSNHRSFSVPEISISSREFDNISASEGILFR